MSNAMRSGKRLLAGLASGALVLTGVAIATAPSASAAETLSVFCNNTGGGGSGGTAPDVTTIEPNCTLAAGLTTLATFGLTFVGTAQADAFFTFTVSGDSTFVEDADVTLSADAKTAVVAAANLADVEMTVATAGTRTVSITGGPTALVQNQVDRGTLTVTGTGVGTTLLVNQGYYAVDDSAAQTNTAPVALVHVLDANGVPLSLANASVSGLTTNANGGTIAVGAGTLYVANDCDADGLLTVNDPGATAADDIVTDACDTLVGAGITQAPNLGMWVEWTGPATAAGSYTATFNLTLGASTYPVTVNYVVSTVLAASGTGTLDKAEYAKGALAAFTLCLKDAGGRIVPDGTGWAGVVGGARATASAANAVITNPVTGAATAPGALYTPTNEASTYNGCTNAPFFTPPVDMAAFAFETESSGTAGWASIAASGDFIVADTARIGESETYVRPDSVSGKDFGRARGGSLAAFRSARSRA